MPSIEVVQHHFTIRPVVSYGGISKTPFSMKYVFRRSKGALDSGRSSRRLRLFVGYFPRTVLRENVEFDREGIESKRGS